MTLRPVALFAMRRVVRFLLATALLAAGTSACSSDESGDDTRSDGIGPDVELQADAGLPPPNPAGSDAGAEPEADEQADWAHAVPIDAPVADDCITDVSAGDHLFECGGVDFHTRVHGGCTTHACGLIFDVHGATMTGEQMRRNTELHLLAPPQGYLVVHPSAPGTGIPSWSAEHYPVVLDFMQRMIEAFHVDERRVHVTGFSQGGVMSWWFVCNHTALIDSAAPMAALSDCAQQGGLDPEISLMYMNGSFDPGQRIDAAETMIADLAGSLEMDGEPAMLGGDDTWSHRRWSNARGTELDFVVHDYRTLIAQGHCIPGGTDSEGSGTLAPFNRTTCEGEQTLHWGEVVLQFFIDHPGR